MLCNLLTILGSQSRSYSSLASSGSSRKRKVIGNGSDSDSGFGIDCRSKGKKHRPLSHSSSEDDVNLYENDYLTFHLISQMKEAAEVSYIIIFQRFLS